MISGLDHGLDTAAAVIDDVRALRAERIRVEATTMLRICEWADAHPAPDDEVPAFEDDYLPRVAWDAPAELGASLATTTASAGHRMHEALHVRHRLPRVWARVMVFEVEPWRAHRIADQTIGHPPDVLECLDRMLAPIAHKVGPITLDRVLRETMMRLYPEQTEQDQLDDLDRREVKLLDQLSHNGVAQMHIRGDIKDLHDFDATVAEIAQALADDGCPDSLDVRRSLAVGVLADPERAADLLNRDRTDTPDTPPDSGAGPARPRTPRKRATLVLHLSEEAVAGHDTVGRCERGNLPMLEQQIRDWCGRTDTHLTVKPVIDLREHHHVGDHEIPDRISQATDLRDRTCVFPWCSRPARRCDHDHTIPHRHGGATCECNIAPLCRRHHRLKTHTAWGYTTIEPGTYLWRSPHGYQFLRDHTGTLDVTPPGAARPGNGCHRTRAP